MAIFFIDLNKLKEYNENMFQVEQKQYRTRWLNIEQYRHGNMEQYGAERSKDDYIS